MSLVTSCAGQMVTRSPGPAWGTTFEVTDIDAVVRRATAARGSGGEPEDMIYGRFATITDPFGVEFSVITRPPESS